MKTTKNACVAVNDSPPSVLFFFIGFQTAVTFKMLEKKVIYNAGTKRNMSKISLFPQKRLNEI